MGKLEEQAARHSSTPPLARSSPRDARERMCRCVQSRCPAACAVRTRGNGACSPPRAVPRRERLPTTPLTLALSLVTTVGCASIPPGAVAVDSVIVRGNEALSSSDVEDRIATAASPKLLGLFRGVIYDYQLFDRSVL